jgi:L-aminopeptidase/D-esterase-like protein
MRRLAWKGGPQPGTTIGLIATDAHLSKGMAKRLAIAAHLGLAKALNLSHALFDGDTIFSAATGRKRMHDPAHHVIEICAAATNCMARAIARGVHAATALPFAGALPAWADKFAGPRVS